MIAPPDFLLRRWDARGVLPTWAVRLWRRLHWCGDLDGLLVVGRRADHYCECVDWPWKWREERDRQMREPLTEAEIDALFEPPQPKSPEAYEP